MLVFFFKQKTAYELRISDWSSDVCSSDLQSPAAGRPRDFQRCHHHPQARPVPDAPTAAQNRIAAARAPALAPIRFQHRPRARTAKPSPRTKLLRSATLRKAAIRSHFFLPQKVWSPASRSEEHTSELQ